MSNAATTKCGKCGGKGYLAAYSHVNHGRCFGCDGTGRVHADGSVVVVLCAAAQAEKNEAARVAYLAATAAAETARAALPETVDFLSLLAE